MLFTCNAKDDIFGDPVAALFSGSMRFLKLPLEILPPKGETYTRFFFWSFLAIFAVSKVEIEF